MKSNVIFIVFVLSLVLMVSACGKKRMSPSEPDVYTPQPTNTPAYQVPGDITPAMQTATALVSKIPHRALYQAVQTEVANIAATAVAVATRTAIPTTVAAAEIAATTVAQAYATAETMLTHTDLADAVTNANEIATVVINALETQVANATQTFVPTISGNFQNILDIIVDAAATQEAIQTQTPVQTVSGIYAVETAAINAIETIQVIATETVIPGATGDAEAIATAAVQAYQTAEAQITSTVVPTVQVYVDNIETAVATLTPTWIQTQVQGFIDTVEPTAEAVASAVMPPLVEAQETAVALIVFNGLTYNDWAEFPQVDESFGEYYFHSVSSFWIGRNEISYKLWYTVKQWAASKGYTFANAGREGNDGIAGAAPSTAQDEPVTSVSWRDAIVWCNAFSQMQSLAPCYTYLGSAVKNSSDAAACDNAVFEWGNGYRLPTEGEWQFAAMWQGNDSSYGAGEYPTGSGKYWTIPSYASGAMAACTSTAQTGLVAWYEGNSGLVTHNVGLKVPNALGIYDMSGNVAEWCWDWYGSYPVYEGYPKSNYSGPATGTKRVVRGGNFYGTAENLQIGYRNSSNPYAVDAGIGFRVVRGY